MFSVKQLMEEGVKFIIPPPKYHPYPNILPVLDPSFVSDKMAANTPYHRVPEDEPTRPSMETIPGDDQRLLDTDSLYDNDSPAPAPPKRGIFKIKLSYHPTFHLRLIVFCLSICAFSVFIAFIHDTAIPSVVFLAFAILRNIIVLYSHVAGHCLIRIRIEIVGRAPTPSTKSKKWLPSWFSQRLIQVAIDWILISVLLLTSIIASQAHTRYYYWNRGILILPACILTWIALPLWALSTIDMGKPSRLSFTHAISFDTSKEKEDDAEGPLLPRTYRDVEASGGLQGDMTRKTGADSPPMI